MRVRLWGVRGSLATPMSSAQLRDKARGLLAEATPADLASLAAIERYLDRSAHSWTYGGNTSCVEVSFADQLFVLDAGTGLRALGQRLREEGRDRQSGINIFFTHFHWDHICGLPFFGPIYMPGRRIDIWSGRSDAEKLLAVQMGSAHFPVKWPSLPSKVACHRLPKDKPTTVAGAEVRILPLIHPDLAFGYRISVGGRSVCYLTDTEVSKNPYRLAEVYSAFVSGADVVIVDAMYGFLEYHDKVNFGHSTIYNFIDFFKETDIGELVIFHHDPLASDPNVTQLWREAMRYKAVIAPQASWKLSAAFEGQEWNLDESIPTGARARKPAARKPVGKPSARAKKRR
jgi:phosphoribosyl 1,2-cyclic phosphodiesterase